MSLLFSEVPTLCWIADVAKEFRDSFATIGENCWMGLKSAWDAKELTVSFATIWLVAHRTAICPTTFVRCGEKKRKTLVGITLRGFSVPGAEAPLLLWVEVGEYWNEWRWADWCSMLVTNWVVVGYGWSVKMLSLAAWCGDHKWPTLNPCVNMRDVEWCYL